jgi:hypothetical protein
LASQEVYHKNDEDMVIDEIIDEKVQTYLSLGIFNFVPLVR